MVIKNLKSAYGLPPTGVRRIPGREGKVQRLAVVAMMMDGRRVGALAIFLLISAASSTAKEAVGPPERVAHVDQRRSNYTAGIITRDVDVSPAFIDSISLFLDRMLAGIQRRVSAERNAGRGGGYYLEVVVVGIRAKFVAPVLWVVVVICLVMSVMLGTEVVLLSAVSLFVKLFRRRPTEKRYKWHPIDIVTDDDLEAAAVATAVSSPMSLAFPLVLVQIPMYNEKEVHLSKSYFKYFITHACGPILVF